MPLFVLDCSVTMSWCFEDEQDDYAFKVLESLPTLNIQRNSILVPSLWHFEVANVLKSALKNLRISKAKSIKFLSLLDKLPITVDDFNTKMTDVITLAEQYSLSAYDATYLNLCLKHDLPLATYDNALATALQKAGGELYLR